MIVDFSLMPGAAGHPPGSAKVIANESAIIFFRFSVQHSEVKAHGLTYDDHQGNAVAGSFINDQRIDIRFHRDFSDARIRNLWSGVRAEPSLSFLRDWTLYYQGRLIA